MATKQNNPFGQLLDTLTAITRQPLKPLTEQKENADVRYNGSYTDYYGVPITIEILFDSDQQLGTATVSYDQLLTKIRFRSVNGHVTRYKITEGTPQNLIRTILALASEQHQL